MKRGSKGTPDAIKATRGNPGKRKLQPEIAEISKPASPVSQSAYLAAPDFIADDEVATGLWRKFVAEYLPALPYIKPSDTLGLARWCKAMSQWVAVNTMLSNEMIVYETESKHGKMLRMHPLFQAQGRLEDRLLKIEDRLGLNPMARQALLKGLSLSGFLAGDSVDRNRSDATHDDDDQSELFREPDSSPVGILAVSVKPH